MNPIISNANDFKTAGGGKIDKGMHKIYNGEDANSRTDESSGSQPNDYQNQSQFKWALARLFYNGVSEN